MKRTWLVLDMSYLSWRAYHTTGFLQHKGGMTGVVFGVLRDIVTLIDGHATSYVAFCFDSRTSLRETIFPKYKWKRKDKASVVIDPKELAAKAELRKQILALKDEYLPGLGFANVLHQEGYEADDLIASAVAGLGPRDEAVVVSRDKDMYQLLKQGKVVAYNPTHKTYYTEESLAEEYGVTPEQWAEVKAIAGCDTDCVPGVRGVKEKTACKFLLGQLPKGKVRDAIHEFLVSDDYERNLKLVRLPLFGCDPVKLANAPCVVKMKAWNKLADRLGMKSMVNKLPNELLGRR